MFDIINFHYECEAIHPFQDGNGRVGRLIMFKECLKYNIVPFIIEDEFKFFYYRGLSEYPKVKGYLTDTCLSAQDNYMELMKYFEIKK
ncbi:MAG TPA: Fic family protein [Salinimicrobium sp.]|nr:Fic family protein [Salinimicrobium sp.]